MTGQSMWLEAYWQAIAKLQKEVIGSQVEALGAVAALMIETIQAECRIFLFGTGHSHMLAEEGHFRAGGLAPFVPILFSSVMLHEGTILSGQVERTPGLAGPVLDSYSPQAGEMIIIFSNSGVNQMPVEMALAAKERAMSVVSVTSIAYSKIAPLSSIGQRLHEIADFAIDNCIPPGDALLAVEGFAGRVAPASTLIGSLILNGLVAEVAGRLGQAGQEIPAFVSANMPGAAEHNRRLLEKWRGRNPHI